MRSPPRLSRLRVPAVPPSAESLRASCDPACVRLASCFLRPTDTRFGSRNLPERKRKLRPPGVPEARLGDAGPPCGGGAEPMGMQCRMTMVSSPMRMSLTTSRTIRCRSMTSSVSAALRKRPRKAASVSARRRNVARSAAWSAIACSSARSVCSRWRSNGMRSRSCSSDSSSS